MTGGKRHEAEHASFVMIIVLETVVQVMLGVFFFFFWSVLLSRFFRSRRQQIQNKQSTGERGKQPVAAISGKGHVRHQLRV